MLSFKSIEILRQDDFACTCRRLIPICYFCLNTIKQGSCVTLGNSSFPFLFSSSNNLNFDPQIIIWFDTPIFIKYDMLATFWFILIFIIIFRCLMFQPIVAYTFITFSFLSVNTFSLPNQFSNKIKFLGRNDLQ